MNGSSNIWGYWENGECCLCLYVDGKLKYKKDNTGGAAAPFEYSFDFDWLSKKDQGGTITLKTNKRTHSGSYRSSIKQYNKHASQINFAFIENLGLNFSFAHATGDYRQFAIGGPFAQNPPVAVWVTPIRITAKWVYNDPAGNSFLFLQNASSPFGSAKTDPSINIKGANSEPPSIGPTPPRKDYYTEAKLNYSSPLSKWFMIGGTAPRQPMVLKVDFIRGIDTGTGGTTFVDGLKFKLPGKIRLLD